MKYKLFSDLPPDILEKAEDNYDRYIELHKPGVPKMRFEYRNIGNCFGWSHTNEGENFWLQVNRSDFEASKKIDNYSII